MSNRNTGLIGIICLSAGLIFTMVNTGPAGEADDKSGDAERQRTILKMKAIKIPEVDFKQANIQDVVKFLADASKEFDTVSRESERKGVDIVLKLPPDANAPAEVKKTEDNPFAGTGAVVEASAPAGDMPVITFTARQVSLYDALKLTCDLAGLKMRVRKSIVMLVHKDEPDGEIVNRRYDVAPAVIERLRQQEVK